jgi:biopolymer transport protein ExbB/TolQ
MSFNIAEILGHAGADVLVVLITLTLMGIASMYVGLERWVTFNKARNQSRQLAQVITGHLAKRDIAGALAATQDATVKNAYLGHMLSVALTEIDARNQVDRHGLNAARRAMDRRSVRESAELRRGMNILATTGSTAPFVGLVGTVLGIINAFGAMGESGSGGLASVSAGIAEALIATAYGIAIAIIGVWLYNYFTARVDAIINDITVAIEEFMDWGEKSLLAISEGTEDAPTVESTAK